MNNLETIKHPAVTWVNITNPTVEAMNYLKRNFSFHPLDFEDCLSPAQHPKLDVHDDYLFLIILFPIYNRRTREVTSEEVDIFIGPDFVITSHHNVLPPLMKLFDDCKYDATIKEKMFGAGSGTLIYNILHQLLHYCLPMLKHVSRDIETLRNDIFNGSERLNVRRILDIKRNIIVFRSTMQSHKNIYSKLLHHGEKLFPTFNLKLYFDNLIEKSMDIWNLLENDKENIDALQETNESLISFRLNDIMRILTIISVTVLPASIIASIFGMGPAFSLAFAKNPHNFYLVVGIMILSCATLLFLFKKKKWL